MVYIGAVKEKAAGQNASYKVYIFWRILFIMIEKFLLEGPLIFNLGGRELDYRKINTLPDSDFAKLYLELMLEYNNKDGWWAGGKIPPCSHRHNGIDGPEELRRYYSQSLHQNCFLHAYASDDHEAIGTIMTKFWDMVAQLPEKLIATHATG